MFNNDGGSSDGGACDPNPGNYDIPGNGCDDDGDGMVDNTPVCDQGLAVDSTAAGDFAKAMGLCQTATGASDPKWGVVSSGYYAGHVSTASPNAGQHGLLTQFGAVIVPREGSSLGVLSSGWGREWDDQSLTSCTPDMFGLTAPGCFKIGVTMQQGSGDVPAGYPKATANCPVDSKANDVINFKMQIKVPLNAQGFTFDFDFQTGEWPEYVCSPFNDSFIAYLSSQAFNGGTPENVSFDMNNDPVGVNSGFFDRCTANQQTGCEGGSATMPPVLATSTCPGGTSELQNTGFYNLGTYCNDTQSVGGGATGWLTTSAPAKPGEVMTIEFIIWDTGDHAYDSSVLLDHFAWVPGPTTAGTVRPPK